jgi:hypothetical protein
VNFPQFREITIPPDEPQFQSRVPI